MSLAIVFSADVVGVLAQMNSSHGLASATHGLTLDDAEPDLGQVYDPGVG